MACMGNGLSYLRLLHSLDLFIFHPYNQSDGYYYDRLIPSSLSPEWKINSRSDSELP